jgi:DNA polymerase III subunit beta
MSYARDTMPRQPIAAMAARRGGWMEPRHGARADGMREDRGMKFTVERDALAEAVSWVARALPARAVLPVLTGLLLSAGQEERSDQQTAGGFLTLSCFDYEVSARVRVRAEVAEPGTVLVPGRLLVEIVRSLPQHPVDFADDPDGVAVTCGDAAFTLTPLPLGEYPELPELPQLAGAADGAALAAAIAQVTPAASRDDTLPMLTAVNVELDGTTMTLAATDRYRLAVRDLEWSPAPGLAGQDRISFLVPARTLSEAARMMSHGDVVHVLLSAGETTHRNSRGGPDGSAVASGGQEGSGPPAGGGYGAPEAVIGFESGDRRLTARLLAGEFVKYRSRFPEEFGCTADLPADAFTEAVRRVALVAERGTPVQLSFAPGRVTIGAATQGQARARETVPADFTGGEPSIAFSPQYLLDGVVAATTHPDESVSPVAQVRLRFTSPAKPAVITPAPGSGTGFRYLVVPQRVG